MGRRGELPAAHRRVRAPAHARAARRGRERMTADWTIRAARAPELARLAEIEREAGVRFETIPELGEVPEVLMPPGALARALVRGQVWVAAARADDAPV